MTEPLGRPQALAEVEGHRASEPGRWTPSHSHQLGAQARWLKSLQHGGDGATVMTPAHDYLHGTQSHLFLTGPLYLLTGLQTLKVSEINDMSHSFSPSY